MKYVLNIFLLLMPIVGTVAQESLDQGYIKLEATKVESSNPEEAQMLEMVKGTFTEVSWDGEKSKTTLSMMGGLFNLSNIMDNENNKLDIFFDALGSKIWVDTNLDKAKEEKEVVPDMSGYDVVYNKDVKKKVLDFSTYQVIVTSKDQTMRIEGWLTDEIKTNTNIIQGMEDLDLAGFPVEFTINRGASKVTFTVTDFKDVLAANAFKIDGTGYTKMTPAEFEEMLGGLMGGMGL